jgi:hypothetical protein
VVVQGLQADWLVNVSWNEPAGQPTHEAVTVAVHVPTREEPGAHASVQGRHAVCAVEAWNEPCAQAWQAVWPPLVAWKVPASQGVHCGEDVVLHTPVRRLPALHVLTHGLHAVCDPPRSWNRPAGQSLQTPVAEAVHVPLTNRPAVQFKVQRLHAV